jgi:hypothetical protein
LLFKNQPGDLPEVMLGNYTQRWGKWPMMDAEAIPLISRENKWLELWRKEQSIIV